MDTETKLSHLLSMFPSVNKEVLLEVLLACEGSIKMTESLLCEQLSKVESSSGIDNDRDSTRSETSDASIATEITIPNATPDSKFKPDGNEDVLLSSTPLLKIEKDNRKRTMTLEVNDVSTKKVDIGTRYQSSLNKFTSKQKKADSHVPPSNPELLSPAIERSITLYTKDEIENTLPNVRCVRNFLPTELADETLTELLSRRSFFKDKEFYIAGKKCKSSHQTAVFYEGMQTIHAYDGEFYGNNKHNEQTYSKSIRMCQYLIEDEVEKIQSALTKHPYQVQGKWKADICIGNYFKSNKQHLDWHSDKLTQIGPLPLICSLTFGATRIFRLKKTYGKEGKVNNNPIYNIPLPHNTLLVMLPGTQEEFKHCVPSLTGSLSDIHPISKNTRINLTFRMLQPVLLQKRPKCPICERLMILRRMYKKVSSRGYYFWMCAGNYLSAKECDGFYYADFSRIHEHANNLDPELKLYTKDIEVASKWVAEDDVDALNYENEHHECEREAE